MFLKKKCASISHSYHQYCTTPKSITPLLSCHSVPSNQFNFYITSSKIFYDHTTPQMIFTNEIYYQVLPISGCSCFNHPPLLFNSATITKTLDRPLSLRLSYLNAWPVPITILQLQRFTYPMIQIAFLTWNWFNKYQ